jgi:hypothetical protein
MADQLKNEAEVLFRQVHPSFIYGDEPSSQPFQPTPKDDDRLSVDRSSLTTAADAYFLYTSTGRESAAVYGLELPCISDPLEATEREPANPAHAYADYSAHGVSQQKNKAKRLKQKALARGRLHP